MRKIAKIAGSDLGLQSGTTTDEIWSPELNLWRTVLLTSLRDLKALVSGFEVDDQYYKWARYTSYPFKKFKCGPLGELIQWIWDDSDDMQTIVWIIHHISDRPADMLSLYRQRARALISPVISKLPEELSAIIH